MIGSGAFVGLLAEFRQRKKDKKTDDHSIVDQFQESMVKQSERIERLESANEQQAKDIFQLQEEIRKRRTETEQAEFWLLVEKESSKKLEETLREMKVENTDLLHKNAQLLQENERLRQEVSRLETRLKELKVILQKKKEDDTYYGNWTISRHY